MAQCTFSIPFTVSPEDVSLQARQAIMETGGTFQGDATAGMFDVPTPMGSISGNYTIENNFIHVIISNKPFFVSCSLIESQLKNYFETVA